MNNYYIMKTGAWLQQASGPYASREDAMAAFNEAYKRTKPDNETWRNDFDGYHYYFIVTSLPKIGEPERNLFEDASAERIMYEPIARTDDEN